MIGIKLLNGNMNGHSIELRDKRVAFGLSTKLVFEKYVALHKTPIEWNKFWDDVDRFYTQYLNRQEVAALGAAAFPKSVLKSEWLNRSSRMGLVSLENL